MMTFRLGVDGSLTPWAKALGTQMLGPNVLAVTKSATAVRTNRFMRCLPSENVGEAITVPSRSLGRHCRGTAISLPSLQTP
jgi:hypothetical protein